MEVKIKDYIIDIEKEVAKETKSKAKAKSSVKYSLLLENDMDFIIKKRSARQDKDLVFLVSQDLFYIKNNKSNEVTKLDEKNGKRLIANFQKDTETWIPFTKVTWTNTSSTFELYDLLSNDYKRVAIREGFGGISGYELRGVMEYMNQNKKLLKYYHDCFKTFNNKQLLQAVFYLEKTRNFNNAKYLIDKFANDFRFGRTGNIYDMIALMDKYGFDTNTFIDYITDGLYSQGIDSISWSVFYEYRDYLNMSYDMYGKIKNKYPKHFRTEHDKITLKYNLWSKYKNDLGAFDVTEEQKALEYKNKTYSIVIPEKSADIISEGVNQSNCVASYVKNIKEGKTFVCFMRRNDDLEKSYVTIEVKDGNCVTQYLGFSNRKLINEEMQFIKEWCKKKNLKLL